MVESMSGHLTAMLHARELDLAVLFDTRLHQAQQATGARRWDMAPLLEEDLFLICARARGEGPGNSRGRQLPETITVAELVQEPLILPTGPHGLRSTLDTAFARDRVAPHVVLEVDSLAMVMAAVDAGPAPPCSPGPPWAATRTRPSVFSAHASPTRPRAASTCCAACPTKNSRPPRWPRVWC